MFEGFVSVTIRTDETTSFVRHAGNGPPVLLLHGFPQTHVMWRDIAPALAADFFVVCADLRGYGASGTPMSTTDHAPYAKRAMARDLVQVMAALGVERFAVAGHDRGGRVAYRLALDHPDRVECLALFDVVPTSEVFDRADARLALEFWPWSLLAQPAPLPETLISAAPAAIVDSALATWGAEATVVPDDVREHYVDALRSADHVHAICEEYRAAAGIDRSHDEADRRASRVMTCPVLALWAKGGSLDRWYEDAGGPLGILRRWAPDVRGYAVGGGHFFPEQRAAETTAALRSFLHDAFV